MKLYTTLVFVIVAFVVLPLNAQDNSIEWTTIENVEDSLSRKRKKTILYFYTDWCVYCKKMEQSAFRDLQVIEKLKMDYYTIKLNAETADTIQIGNDQFINKNLKKSRNPTHELAELLGSRKDKPFVAPVIVLFDEQFNVIKRSFEYLSPKELYQWIQ